MKLNIAMIVKNESRSLRKCLEAAAPYSDDIIVVDTGSTDDTCEIAGSFPQVKLYHFDWVDDFSAARNFSLERSEENGADYTLVLDADEYLRRPEQDVREFLEEAGSGWAGYLVRYDQFYNDDDQIDVSETRTTRLLPRGVRYEGIIHEQPVFDGTRIYTPFVADHDGYLDRSKGKRNLTYLEKAIEQTPDDPYLYYQMGVALRSEKETIRASECFGRFYDMIHDSPEAFTADYVRDGVIRYLYTLTDLNTRESLARTLYIVHETGKYYMENTDFYFFCGIFYMKLVLSDTAKYISYLPLIEKSYQKCLDIGERDDAMTVKGTGSFKAYHNLGLWYQLNGQEDKAQECFDKEKSTSGIL